MSAQDLAVWAESLAEALDQAPRLGAVQDSPEGARWIILSNTLAQEVALRLRQAAGILRERTV